MAGITSAPETTVTPKGLVKDFGAYAPNVPYCIVTVPTPESSPAPE